MVPNIGMLNFNPASMFEVSIQPPMKLALAARRVASRPCARLEPNSIIDLFPLAQRLLFVMPLLLSKFESLSLTEGRFQRSVIDYWGFYSDDWLIWKYYCALWNSPNRASKLEFPEIFKKAIIDTF